MRTILLTLLLTGTVMANDNVTVTQDDREFTLANGLVTAKISKRNGNLVSLQYQGIETLNTGYWSHNAASPQTTNSITINNGALAEVSIKGFSGGQRMGSGPGGSTIADIEIRYALARGVPGIYTYSEFDHKPDYPATSVGEARFCAKLNDVVFDWMTIDANRNMKMITAYDWNHGTVMNAKEMRRMNSGIYKGQVEHKYDYSANQFDVLAWGWSSTTTNIGLWFINPTIEYLSGGPTKFELSAHRDATFDTNNLAAPAPPCLLNYWRGSHYGGSTVNVADGEHWTKVIGPFLIYCNAGPTPDAMWKDALAQSKKESAAWPYTWVAGVDYPVKRGAVTGQFTGTFTNLLVGLATANWQTDAKHYQFWARGDATGKFTIPNVRPGTYELHAITDGILGEFVKTNVIVTAAPLDLGKLDWKPVRYGKQLWDIGIPNRSAREFFKGDNYFHWGWYLEYAKLFPNDVNFVIGKSDYRKDWFIEQVPHNENPGNTTGRGEGRATTWTITFPLDKAPTGKATLRLAICGVGTKSIEVTVNDKPAGTVTGLVYNATINRDGIGGAWVEKDVTFDAALMKAGDNVLKLTIPAGGLMNGIMYDYVRLEVE